MKNLPRQSQAWLREAWQAKRFLALASHDTFSELLRVLAYPKFKLTRDEQQTLLADILPYVETVKIDTTPDGLPDIRDADDIIFLVLAEAGRADALLSGDGDIQAVRDPFVSVRSSPLESRRSGVVASGINCRA